MRLRTLVVAAVVAALPLVAADPGSLYARTRLLEGAMRAALALEGSGLCLSVVRFFGTSELIEHWRALAHLFQTMPLGCGGSSGGFGW